jgi:hypothetical protein
MDFYEILFGHYAAGSYSTVVFILFPAINTINMALLPTSKVWAIVEIFNLKS